MGRIFGRAQHDCSIGDRLSRTGAAAAAAFPVRIYRWRLLWRGDASPQHRRSRSDYAAPARAARRVEYRYQHHPVRRETGPAGGARADRPGRHERTPRRGAGGARGRGGGRALHPVDDVRLPTRRSDQCGQQGDLVSALCHQGSRLHARSDRAGRRSRLFGADVHRRSAGRRQPLPRLSQRHVRRNHDQGQAAPAVAGRGTSA